MVVVILVAGAAGAMLYAYHRLPSIQLEAALFSIGQQAAVMAALSTAVFTVIAALRQGKMPAAVVAGTTLPPALAPISGFAARA